MESLPLLEKPDLKEFVHPRLHVTTLGLSREDLKQPHSAGFAASERHGMFELFVFAMEHPNFFARFKESGKRFVSAGSIHPEADENGGIRNGRWAIEFYRWFPLPNPLEKGLEALEEKIRQELMHSMDPANQISWNIIREKAG